MTRENKVRCFKYVRDSAVYRCLKIMRKDSSFQCYKLLLSILPCNYSLHHISECQYSNYRHCGNNNNNFDYQPITDQIGNVWIRIYGHTVIQSSNYYTNDYAFQYLVASYDRWHCSWCWCWSSSRHHHHNYMRTVQVDGWSCLIMLFWTFSKLAIYTLLREITLTSQRSMTLLEEYID